MAIEGDIQAVLAATASAFPLIAPDSTPRPYLTYQVISNVQENTLEGSAGVSNRRVQVDAWADSYGAAKTLAASVTASMELAAFTNIKLSDRDLHEPELKLFRVSMDFSVWAEA